MISSAVLGTLAGVILAGGFGVVATRSVVYATLYLLLTLVGVAVTFLVLLAEFLALVQVLIYGGAITIVLLFAIMLTRAPEQSHVEDNPQRPFAALAAGGFFVLLASAILTTPWAERPSGMDPSVGFFDLSTTLFGDFVVPFEIASLVLLIALIGAVVLTRSRKDGE
ncbi:MAG: NADH-quinone oxidoreductase subunit J [Chloroflexi bacterium]|nr:NADH-quinone oxidoreductase subunit J [Chloroflexota bacterium]